MKKTKVPTINFKNKHIIVVGDVMLDRFIIGTVDRISPEAPVPVVSKKEEVVTLGGAGNVAHNIVSLGGKVSLFGIVGNDASGRIIKTLLKTTKNVQDELVMNKRYVTTDKTRIVSHGQHMVRIDTEDLIVLHKKDEETILSRYKLLLKKTSVVILSDYTKGMFSKEFAEKLIVLAHKQNVRVIVDTKPRHVHFFKGAYCIKPNKKEALLMSSEKEIHRIAEDIATKLHTNVLITLGEEGMYIYEKGKGHQIETKAKRIFDVVGAGDTVVATLALVLSDKKASLTDAAIIANHAAGVVVSKRGTATLTEKELVYSLKND